MNPKQFLLIGGIILIIVAILGFFGVIGPTPERSIFGDFWWFDNGENWAHLSIGIVGVISGYSLPTPAQRSLVVVLGVIALYFGIYNLFSTRFLGTNLERPADTILHLAIGVWALYASMGKQME